MLFLPFYLDCLSQASYLIGDETTGQAVVVDPRRDVVDYLEAALAHDLSIVGAINTHLHANFVSGHLELARATGAWIGYGPGARAEYDLRRLEDGERVQLGGPHGLALEIVHTPGHTPESISVLVYEHADDAVPYGVLTGDTLSEGEVGRPDLVASGVLRGWLAVQRRRQLSPQQGYPGVSEVLGGHNAWAGAAAVTSR